MSDAGVEEKIFAKGGDEQGVDDVDDSDDDLEQTEVEMPTEAEPGTDRGCLGVPGTTLRILGRVLLQQTRVHIHRNESLQSSIRMLLKERVY